MTVSDEDLLVASVRDELPKQASNADLVRWAVERVNDHDVESLKLFWAKDAVERFPDRTCQGVEEIAAYFETS